MLILISLTLYNLVQSKNDCDQAAEKLMSAVITHMKPEVTQKLEQNYLETCKILEVKANIIQNITK